MNKHVIIGAMAFLAGCTQTKTTNEAQTATREVLTVTGTIEPLRLHIERNGNSETSAQIESKTRIDGAAIAQEVAGVVSKTLEIGIAKMTGIQSGGGDSGLATLLGAAGGGTGILYGLQQMLARREEAQRHATTRKARDDLFDKSLDLAKKLPPESA
jgi:predicted phage tail protein